MKHFWVVGMFVPLLAISPHAARAEFQAGAARVNVTPDQLPVLINGSMLTRSADKVKTPVSARALVLKQGDEQVALVVVDSCMMPRELLDEAKKLASDQTGIRQDHILISATHAHSAPSSGGALGTSADPNYVPFLRAKLVEAIATAQANLAPAKVGWGQIDAPQFTALRRWIRRPDRVAEDPFGNPTVRANMHAGRNWDDVVGESGPEDPVLSLISFQSPQGKPIALLANFSMHYFGDESISADYYGLFCEGLKHKLSKEAKASTPEFVGIMSHGCSGDIWRRDYTKPDAPENDVTIEAFTDGLLKLAFKAYEAIEYQSDPPLKMEQMDLAMKYRVPDKQRLEWAKKVMEELGDAPPKTIQQVYAREQVLLDELQQADVIVQALRVGSIGIASTPTETYALTGLKIKLQSPLDHTIVIELANGSEGYIPPPEQHQFGGYNTWPARSAGLEVNAERKISETDLRLLEQVSGKPRKSFELPHGPATEAVLKLDPVAYWRLNEFAGPRAVDASKHHHDAIYEPRVAFFLEGPLSDQFTKNGETNRSAHFVDDRLRAQFQELGSAYSISLWIWNGMPTDARPVSGWFFSTGPDFGLNAHGIHLGIGGKDNHPGALIFQNGKSGKSIAGSTELARWSWHHVVLVRDGQQVRIYLDGNSKPEIDVTTNSTGDPKEEFFFGGRSDNDSNWEGRLDEIAVFNRALSPEQVHQLFPKTRH